MQDNNMNFASPINQMNNEDRGCGCGNSCDNGCGCANNGIFGGDSTILFFIIIFLLLFTNFGCGCCRG